MARPTKYTFAPANVDVNFIVEAEAPTEATPMTIVHANCNGDGLAHQLDFDSSGDVNTIVFTIVGTDADDKPQTGTVTGVTTTLVESSQYWKTVTSITPSATSAETVTVGFVDEFVTATQPLRWQEGDAPAHFYYDEVGTANIDIEFTNSDLSDQVTYANQEARPWFIVISSLDDETADGYVEVPSGLTGWRLKANSYTDTAVFNVYVSQADSNQKFS